MTATFVRRAGQGPAVVCLHANAASSSQWRGLMDRLSTRYTVVAPDAYGSGKGPAWTEPRLMDLEDEAALIRPLLDGLDCPLCFVGHSHGAAVALLLALEMHRHQPGRVAALALYEPTLFAVALQLDRHDPDVAGIQDAVRRSVALTAAGDPDRGAGAFIDYWMGDGAWAATSEAASRRSSTPLDWWTTGDMRCANRRCGPKISKLWTCRCSTASVHRRDPPRGGWPSC